MNLTKLFETQKILRDRINYNEPDRFNKLILALLVELGECANEWRGFKFWSNDQEPRTKCEWDYTLDDEPIYRNLLLEEYVDKLHFILELGLEIEFDEEMWGIDGHKLGNITDQFIKISQKITDFWDGTREIDYVDLLETFIGLGEMLGFTWEQVEQAYYEKNKINHIRQESGY